MADSNIPPVKRLSLYDHAPKRIQLRELPTVPEMSLNPPEGSEPTLSIVIPAKNEARNLPHVFEKLPEDCEVILVDGNSADDTVSVAHRLRPDITVIGQTRQGKGNALACGFATAKGDFIVMIDADGSNNPAEIPRFVAVLKGGADFAKGSRFLAGGGSSRHQFGQEIRQLLAQQDRESALRNSIHGPVLRLQRLPTRVPGRHEA